MGIEILSSTEPILKECVKASGLMKKEYKHTILLAELQTRREALETIRTRALNIISSISVGAIALIWLLISQCNLSILQQFVLSVFIFGTVYGVYRFINSLAVGFDNTRNIMIEIERELDMYKQGSYIQNDALLPEQYKQNANSNKNAFFGLLKQWLWFLFIITLTLIWLPCNTSQKSRNQTINATQENVQINIEKSKGE